MTAALLEIFLILFLMLLNGLFAMTEIAIVSSRKALLQSRADAGSQGAARALKLAESPNRFLSTVQIGITLVGIFAGAYGGASLSARLVPWIEPIPWIGPHAPSIAFFLIILTLTYLSLIFGELAPKRLAMRHPEAIASFMATPMSWLSRLATPAVWLLSESTNRLLHPLGIHDEDSERLSREEINVMIREGMVSGSIDPSETRMMEGVLRFEDLDVYDLMIPRPKMIWIEKNEPHSEVWPRLLKSSQPLFPIYDTQPDQLLGVFSLKDCYAQLAAGIEVRFANLAQAPLLAPETQKATTLLNEFKRTGHRAAIVVDEFGRVVGMVTLMDLLEAIVGDVPSREERLSQPIRQSDDGSWLIDGLFDVSRLAQHLEAFPPPEGSGQHFKSIAGWFAQHLARLPQEGDRILHHGWSFEVIDMDGSRLDKVLARRTPEAIAQACEAVVAASDRLP